MDDFSSILRNTSQFNPINSVQVGICRGALGELFQGPSEHTSGEIVIISSLIPQYSRVYFTPVKKLQGSIKEYKKYFLNDPEHNKAFRALDIFCRYKQLNWPIGKWEFNSDLEVARGMASSTADIVAIIRCVANYYKESLSLKQLLQILFEIERSDSVFLETPTLFCSSHHRIIKQFKKFPPIYALFMHENETINTDDTKLILLEHYQKNKSHYSRLYQDVIEQFTCQNTKAICQLSTRSSELSQKVIPKLSFHQVHQKMGEFQADGIITAHTGSAIGYLYCQRPDIKTIESVSLFFKKFNGDWIMIFPHIADAIKTPHIIHLKNNLYVARFESMKIYSTLAAVEMLLNKNLIKPNDTLLDSSSGIYAYALALACQKYQLKCHIIASKTVDKTLKTQLEIMGATVEPAASAPNLKMDQENRVKRIQEILKQRDDIHWMQQYHDEIHYLGYQEFSNLIINNFDSPQMTIVGGVGSGCSTGAITTFLREAGVATELHGIQPFGSMTFNSQHIEDPGIIIAGIGSAIPFKNVRYELYDHIHWISFDYSSAGANHLLKKYGIFAGLSSGSCYTVANWCHSDFKHPCLFIAADMGHRYIEPVFQNQSNYPDPETLQPLIVNSPEQMQLPWSCIKWARNSQLTMPRKSVNS